MRLSKISELEDFKKAIRKCKGDVWLESPYGDCFNLKSTLSAYIAFGRLLEEHGEDLELFCQYTTDEIHFYNFFSNYPETT